jgi:uncharacterized protein (TIRG00374 family)
VRRYVREAGITAAGIAISVFSLYVVAGSVNLSDAARIALTATPGLLLIAVAVIVAAFGFRLAVCRVLTPVGPDGAPVPLRRLISPVLIGYLGNLVLPARLGEVVRVYLISRRETITIAATFGAVVLERWIDTAVLAVLAFVAAIVVHAEPWIVQGTGAIAAVATLAVLLLATTGLHPFVDVLKRLGAGNGILRRPIAAAVRLVSPFVRWSGGAHRRRAIAQAALFSLGAWLANVAMFWLVGEAVGASLGPGQAILVTAVSVLSTAIPSAPGYVGTFELACVAVARSNGVPADVALAMAVLAHVLGLLPAAIGGSVALIRLGRGLRGLSAEALAQLPPAES